MTSRDSATGIGAQCQVAREMIAYNKSQTRLLDASFNLEQQREASVDDYRVWAAHLRTYSARISTPELSPPAGRLADEADQLVKLVEQVRADTSVPDPSAPPPWLKPYAQIARQFHDNLAALDRACPAQ
ncbi:hypothetical protein ACQ856_30235 (plasmid) [Mycolicibacterium psychrotolerans]|uniref:hypothetical protein n=1 Tax=Mycolicibacterium psychrotolerans TaxID=216929 RepID=UPI003D666C02